MENKNKKKSGFPVFPVIVALIFVTQVPQLILPIIITAVVLIIIKALKAGKSNNSAASFDAAVSDEKPMTINAVPAKKLEGIAYYKNQLDGFLKAGIIDRKEYSVLMDKYTRALNRYSE